MIISSFESDGDGNCNVIGIDGLYSTRYRNEINNDIPFNSVDSVR